MHSCLRAGDYGMLELNGIIIKSLSGFYYVEAAGVVYECRAKGLMRSIGVTPVTGDNVIIETNGDGKGTVSQVLERKSFMQRPPVANMEILFIVISTCEPEPNFFVANKLTAFAVNKGIEPVIVITKTDLAPADRIRAHYSKSMFRVLEASAASEESLKSVADTVKGKICAFTGNSGVGKSTLLNAVMPSLSLETGQISKKLGRGRHTTRAVELYSVCGGRIADTPGFSSLDYENGEIIMREDLPYCFPEFVPFLGKCRFSSCAHTVDKGCEVLRAVENGEITRERHESYIRMYEEVKDIREWNIP